MRADGTNVERLTRSGRARHAAVSPDATMLALEIDGDVHVLTMSDRRIRRLTWAPQDGVLPSWSPDGQRLAFVTRRRGRPEIFTTDLTGNDQQLLVSMAQGGATAPRWSPDGTHLVFVHLRDAGSEPLPESPAGTIYLVELGSGRLTRLSP
jgi:TolB protein